jgi:hypothetical protein
MGYQNAIVYADSKCIEAKQKMESIKIVFILMPHYEILGKINFIVTLALFANFENKFYSIIYYILYSIIFYSILFY